MSCNKRHVDTDINLDELKFSPAVEALFNLVDDIFHEVEDHLNKDVEHFQYEPDELDDDIDDEFEGCGCPECEYCNESYGDDSGDDVVEEHPKIEISCITVYFNGHDDLDELGDDFEGFEEDDEDPCDEE
jgi:hypothetical protein